MIELTVLLHLDNGSATDKQTQEHEMKTNEEKLAYILDRLESWHESAMIAAIIQERTQNTGAYRNEMMNYAHLIDIVNSIDLEKTV